MTHTGDRKRWRAARIIGAAALALVLAACADSVEDLEREARAYVAKGDRMSALIQYKALLQIDANNTQAQLQVGKLAAETGHLKEAEAALKRAEELGIPREQVVMLLVPVLLELENFNEALELLEPNPKRAQTTDPKVLGELALLRGRAYIGRGDLTSAGTEFQLAVDSEPAKAKLGLARIAEVRNDRARAEELIAEVLAANPKEVEAHIALGELKRNAGEIDKALPHYAEAVRLEPGNVNAVLNQAIGLAIADRTDEARVFLESARKLAPAKPLVHFVHAMIECRARNYGPCSESLQKVFDVVPQYMPAVLLAGQLNHSLGNLELAQAAFMRYLERFPRNTYARKMLASTLLANGQAAAALSLLRPLYKANTEDADVHGIAGQALLHLGHLRQARIALARAVKLAPGNGEFHTALATAHLASGMRQRAEADYRAAIALKPPGTKADYGLVMLLLAENKMAAAKEAADAVSKRLPGNPDAHMLKGIVSRMAGDTRGARQSFLRALELNRDFFSAVEELARMDLQEGKPDVARMRVQEVLRRDRNHLRALLTMARIDFADGRRADGLGWTRQAADAHPRSSQAMLLMAETQLEAGEASEAIGSARKALHLQPNDVQALRALGQAQMAAKDYVGAAMTFSSLVSAQPGAMDGYLQLATAHLASGDVTSALSVARNAVKRDPRSGKAQALLADVLLQSKKYSDALEFARQVQRDSPQSALGFRLEGEALLAQGETRKAIKPFETAAKLEPSGLLLIRVHQAQSGSEPASASTQPLEEWAKKNPDDVVPRMYLADALSGKGRHKEAITHYQELLQRDPKDVRVLNNLAWALLTTGDTRALEYAERAYQLMPNAAPVLDTYGWILASRGRLQEGIPLLLKAVTIEAKNPEIRFHLGKALAQAGDRTRARRELKTALDLGNPFPQAEEARKLLASLGQ